MNVWDAIKIGAFIVWSAFAYWEGGIKAKEVEAKDRATQLAAIAKGFETQALKLQSVENAYDAIKDLPDPVSTGLATRLQVLACATDVPAAGTVAGGTHPSGPVPASAERSTRLFELAQSVFDACSADAKELNALIGLAPVHRP